MRLHEFEQQVDDIIATNKDVSTYSIELVVTASIEADGRHYVQLRNTVDDTLMGVVTFP